MQWFVGSSVVCHPRTFTTKCKSLSTFRQSRRWCAYVKYRKFVVRRWRQHSALQTVFKNVVGYFMEFLFEQKFSNHRNRIHSTHSSWQLQNYLYHHTNSQVLTPVSLNSLNNSWFCCFVVLQYISIKLFEKLQICYRIRCSHLLSILTVLITTPTIFSFLTHSVFCSVEAEQLHHHDKHS